MILAALALVGCAGAEEEGTGLTWQGETPHLLIEGRLDGEDISIEISGEEAASGSRAWCAREYEAPTLEDGSLDLTQARSSSTEINGLAIINGEERSFELEIRQHAMQRGDVGARISVIPRPTEPAAHQAWLDWEWHLGDVDLYEASAQDGSIDLNLFTGAPGEGGIVIPSGEGAIGGVIDARWSIDESLRVTFTLPCVETEVEGL